MIEDRGKDLIIKRPAFPIGLITEGDPLDRPDGSLAIAENVDYDEQTGIIETRNGTVNSNLLDGFTMPSGYNIIPGGLKVFSFNEPIGRSIVLLYIRDSVNNIKIYVSAWYNPPAPNTDPVGSNNNYENHISSKPVGWNDEWIELTEYEPVVDFVKTGLYSFTVDGSALSYSDVDAYRGWFLFNLTKYNSATTEKVRNESFACIESYDGGNNLTVQGRLYRNLNDLNWTSGDECILVRFPFLVYEANDITSGELKLNFTPETNDWLIKTNTSIESLINKDGGLWFGFVNKDTLDLPPDTTIFSYQNRCKRYGWWLDYSVPPVMPDTASYKYNSGSNYSIYFNHKIGLELGVSFSAGASATNSVQMYGVALKYDGFQKIMILDGFDKDVDTSKYTNFLFKPYHNYSRRQTALLSYLKNTTNEFDDPAYSNVASLGVLKKGGAGQNSVYEPYYDFGAITFSGYFSLDSVYATGNTLESDCQYISEEAIYLKSSLGIFAQGRLFVNDFVDPDAIRYSLFQRESIIPLQNKRSIDSSDKDKVTAINLLGVNPVVFKNNSYHIINIEGQSEVGWRLIHSKSTMGCPYPNTVCRTNYGIVFANEQGVWLLSDDGEPLDLLGNNRRLEWLALPNKSSFIFQWQPKKKRLWAYVGDNTFWVCTLKPQEGKRGWRNYTFNFTPVDIITDEDNEFYIITADGLAIRVLGDNEMSDGTDADGSVISYHYRENFNTLGRYTPFHHIETVLNFKPINKDSILPNGNMATIELKLLRELDQIIQTKSAQWNVLTQTVESAIMKNNKADRQRALALDVSGDLTWHKKIRFYEINSRIKRVVTQTKAGYKEIGN